MSISINTNNSSPFPKKNSIGNVGISPSSSSSSINTPQRSTKQQTATPFTSPSSTSQFRNDMNDQQRFTTMNTNLNKSLDEEIEYFSSPEEHRIDTAPSPIKNDYRKDPEYSPSMFTKYPSTTTTATFVQNQFDLDHSNNSSNKKGEEIYDNLFEDDDDLKEMKPFNGSSSTNSSSFSNQQQQQTSFADSMVTTPTKRLSSPFPKLNRSSNPPVENFSTPNASRLLEKKSFESMMTTDTSNMELEEFEQFNVDNIITPIRESTFKQISSLRSSDDSSLNSSSNSSVANLGQEASITKIEKRHQELFHHYLEEKGDLRNAMLLLNQFHMKQHKMNVLNFKLNSINLVANFANAVKSQKLQLELHKSKKAVANLNGKVEYLNETVEDLNSEVEQHKSSLSSFMQKYYRTVEELQQNQLVQKMQLDDIMRLKSREGVTVDLLILLAVSYLVRSSRVFHRFLKFIFMFLPFNSIVIVISKILTTIGLMLLSRKAAIQLGVHAGATSVAYGLFQTLQFSFNTAKSFVQLLKIMVPSSKKDPDL